MDDHAVVVPPLEAVLACPRCHGMLGRRAEALVCSEPSCGFIAELPEGIVNLLGPETGPSFFDSNFPVMIHGSEEPGTRGAFYLQQAEALRERLAGAAVVLDVGCGPKLMYVRPAKSLLFGLDPSFESLRHNKDVDVRIFGSATSLPFPARSVDAIVCFYSLHHLVGKTVEENERLLQRAMTEFGRVLRPGGDLLVFEVTPWRPTWALQCLAWNLARRSLGERLDMFFWERQALSRLAAGTLPAGATLRRRDFSVPALTIFPPVFALQWLRIPRALYPFHISLYHWRMAE